MAYPKRRKMAHSGGGNSLKTSKGGTKTPPNMTDTMAEGPDPHSLAKKHMSGVNMAGTRLPDGGAPRKGGSRGGGKKTFY